jgi:hypothetical protein
VHISPQVTYLYRFLGNFNILPFFWPIQKWSVYGPTALPPELCTVQYLLYSVHTNISMFDFPFSGLRAEGQSRSQNQSLFIFAFLNSTNDAAPVLAPAPTSYKEIKRG